MQRSSLVQGHTTVESKRSGVVARILFACGFAVATLSVGTSAHASQGKNHHDQAVAHAPAHQSAHHAAGHAVTSGPKANPDKKAAAKAAREKRKAERAARREQRLAKAKAKRKAARRDRDKVAKADKPINDDMGGSDDPLEGL